WYIELTKASLQSGDNEEVTEAASVLYYVLKTALKLLHPFAPFVTEKIYSELNTGDKTIMLSEFPVKNRRFSKYPDAKRFETIKEIIKSIRNLRLETGVAPSQKVTLNILTPHENYVKRNEHYIKKLANVAEIKFITGKDDIIEKTANIVLLEAELFIPLGELIDFEKERARLTKEFEKLQIEIKRGEGMLSNIGFVNKAPVTLIDAEKQKLEENKIKSEKIKLRIAEL
ncbi:MAG: class I tRNA ligase family protein, partial [Christensenellaceae bacterium]|nr:class I tRNA ligase family protein [Christensenellaceae bacterium]